MTNIKKLKKGNYIVHENEPCVIKNVEFLQNKNNPIAKVELEGIFSGNHYTDHLKMHQNIQEADLTRKCGTVVSKKKGKIQIMDLTTFETFDAEISQTLLDKAQEGDNVTFIHFGDSTKIIEVRK